MDDLKINIKVFPHAESLPLPRRMTAGSSGADLRAAIDEPLCVKPRSVAIIPLGIAISLPIGYEGQIRSRSGLAFKHGIAVLNAPGTIDSDYRDEIKVILINHSDQEFIIERGMRIAQMVVAKYANVDWQVCDSTDSPASERCGGFGSTGLQ